jgi:tRNA threonylcarbamoyl adenosine modification protein YeaZ
MMPGTLVLCMDSATDVCSVAAVGVLGKDAGRLLAERMEGGERLRAAQLLLPMASAVLAEVGAEAEDIAAVVVGTGPGTFTGVRIAVATARALALSLEVPVFGVTSLAALASEAAAHAAGDQAVRAAQVAAVSADTAAAEVDPAAAEVDPAAAAGTVDLSEAEIVDHSERQGSLLVPIVDARRGQVFAAVFESRRPRGTCGAGDAPCGLAEEGPVWQKVGPLRAIDSADLVEWAAGQADGRPLCIAGRAELVPEPIRTREGVRFAPIEVRAGALVEGQELLGPSVSRGCGCGEGPSGEDFLGPTLLAVLAGMVTGEKPEAAAPGLLGSPECVRPLYIRPPDADLHIQKMKQPFA